MVSVSVRRMMDDGSWMKGGQEGWWMMDDGWWMMDEKSIWNIKKGIVIILNYIFIYIKEYTKILDKEKINKE
jgi:hypothetical protein